MALPQFHSIPHRPHNDRLLRRHRRGIGLFRRHHPHYDVAAAASLGPLHQFSSSITFLSFYSPPNLPFPRNLLSAGADGTISIFDTEPFVLLKSFRAHTKGINDLAFHCSGKVVLSVSRDGCLAMSNLVGGKGSFCYRLGKEATTNVEFDGSGERFSMVFEERIVVHLAEDARLLFEFEDEREFCAATGESGILFTGGESRNITAWDTSSAKAAYRIKDAHSTFIKGIVVLTKDVVDDDPYLVASASSDGFIHVWDVRSVNKEKPTLLAEANTKSSLT